MNLKKWIALSGAVAAVLVAVMAFLHTPRGLMLYGRMRGSKACPYGMDAAATPQGRTLARAAEADALRGAGRARSMAFLGFELNQTPRSAVDAWAAAHHAQCHSLRVGSSDMECQLPGETQAVGGATPEGTAFFAFDSRELLKSVHLMHHYTDASAAADAFAELRDAASVSLGAQPKQRGEPSPAYLSANVLRQVDAEFRLQDVYARLSATHMPVSYIVAQKYRALSD